MRAPARWILLPSLFIAACSSKTPSSGPGAAKVEATNVDAPCERAAAMRARVAGLRAEGKLDRARRSLERAEAMCPASAPLSWADLLNLDADLGARVEGIALADKVSRDASAPEAAKQAAAALRKAFDAPAPDGSALIEEGIRDLAQGKREDARRAMDRGRIALEAAKGKAMTVVAKGAIEGAVTGRVFRDDGAALAVSHGRFITIVPMDPTKPTSTFGGHGDRVTSVRWIAKGERLASASTDGSILIWNASTTDVEKRFRVEPGDTQIAVSKGDDLLAAGAPEGKRLVVFRIDDGVKSLDVEQEKVLDLGFVPGRREVWVSTSFNFVWWDLGLGKAIHDTSATDSPRILAPNGRDVAIIQNEHELTLNRNYGQAQGPIIARAPGCEAHLFPSFFTPDEKSLVVRRADNVAMSLALPSGQPRWERKGLSESAVVSPDAKLVAEAGAGNVITIRDAKSGAVLHSLEGTRAPKSLDFSPDGNHLVALEGESGISVFRLDKRAPERTIGQDHAPVVTARAGGGKLVVVENRRMFALTLAQPKAIWSVPVSAQFAEIDPMCTRAAIDEGEDVKLWDIGGSGPRATVVAKTAHRLFPTADTVSVNAEKGYSFTLQSGPGGPPERPIPGINHRSTRTADGKLVIAVTEEDGRVGVWDVATGALRCKLGEPQTKKDPWPEDVPSSRDGSIIAAMFKAEIKVYAGCTGVVKKALPTGWTGRPAGTSGVSDDGRYLFFLQDTGSKLHVWDLEQGTHTETTYPDGSRISVGPGGELLLWSSSGATLWRGPDKPGQALPLRGISSASWAGERLFLGAEDGRVFIVAPREAAVVAKVVAVGATPAMMVTTDTGLFEVFGDPGDKLACDLGGVTYPIEVCRERLEVSALLEKVLRGAEVNDL